MCWDAADGGATATIAVLLTEESRLVLAAVGDSSAMLLGRKARAEQRGGSSEEEAGKARGGEVEGLLLIDEHSPTSLAEFERMRRHPEAHVLRWVYDCPDDVRIDVFTTAPGGASTTSTNPGGLGSGDGLGGAAGLDKEAERRADREHECAVKNARGDLVAVIVVPEGSVHVPKELAAAHGIALEATAVRIEEHTTTMSRSLGDVYDHTLGVSSEPEIRAFDLRAEASARRWESCAIILASDGLWDLWTGDEVASMLLPARTPRSAEEAKDGMLCAAADLCEVTRAKGEEYFGERADNLTAVVLPLVL